MNVIVTGGAGFIGSNLISDLLHNNRVTVYCIDNFDPYYDRSIKEKSIEPFLSNDHFHFVECDILDYDNLVTIFKNVKIDVIVHLAGKAGVRPSIEDPISYTKTNVEGTNKMLEFAKVKKIQQFVFGSSSSVYGKCKDLPWNENSTCDPISPYASSKLAGEFLGKVYSNLFDINFIALRFFTVFGPNQRPDLAIHKFINLMSKNQKIDLYGDGSTKRDYTFVSDIVQGIKAAMKLNRPFEVINIASNNPIKLKDLVRTLETVSGIEAKINYMPEQQGDVSITYACIDKAKRMLKYAPTTSLEHGVEMFYSWYENKNK
ncbi:MAG: UDP-glucuronate 4-epimerase [Sphingobacteriales bacterium]|jgi:UDP-glucuronate 4-epimerase